MFIKDGKRINRYSIPRTDARGVTHPRDLTIEELAELGITEIAEPTPPADYSDEFYYRTEQEDAPYVVYTRKSDEQIAQALMARAKVERTATVERLTVTTASGKTFDGDEISQGRMGRAIVALDPLETTLWILADNTPDPNVSREELREALRLAGAAQTAVWVAPYQP